MDKQKIDRPFAHYSNLILGRSERQGIFLEVSQPCLITILNAGPQPGRPHITSLMTLCPRHVRIIRSEVQPAPPQALQMLHELETRIAYSSQLRQNNPK